MNMNIDLKNLKVNPSAILHALNTAKPYLLGVVLVGTFGYTAFVVNSALNVTPVAPPDQTSLGISFDKATLNSLKTLTPVPQTVAPTTLGKSDPFGNN